jgi:hypothetical protein
MLKLGFKGCLAGLALWAGSLTWADAPIPASHVTLPPGGHAAVTAFEVPAAAPSPNAQVNESQATEAPKAPGSGASNPSAASKAALADAYIAQNLLRVYLGQPAAVAVYNSQGQQVAHLDSRRAMEAIPLQGITTGFIYLTVRTAQGETAKKLVYTRK